MANKHKGMICSHQDSMQGMEILIAEFACKMRSSLFPHSEEEEVPERPSEWQFGNLEEASKSDPFHHYNGPYLTGTKANNDYKTLLDHESTTLDDAEFFATAGPHLRWGQFMFSTYHEFSVFQAPWPDILEDPMHDGAFNWHKFRAPPGKKVRVVTVFLLLHLRNFLVRTTFIHTALAHTCYKFNTRRYSNHACTPRFV